MTQNINDILAEREKTHGDFEKQAVCARALKYVIWDYDSSADDVQREALDHIAVKISRILNGDPNHVDAWKDIAGYATLAARHAEKKYVGTHYKVEWASFDSTMVPHFKTKTKSTKTRKPKRRK